MAAEPGRAPSGPRIFVSYRRDDTTPYARNVHDRLVEQFGKDQVFFDVDDIHPGTDFAQAITAALSKCDIVLAVIGPDWLARGGAFGRRRLHDPVDFVRIELLTALEANIPVIPVLVNNARMPTARQLPPELVPFATRQAFELSDRRWSHDIRVLIEAIDLHVSPRRVRIRSARTQPAPDPASIGTSPLSEQQLQSHPPANTPPSITASNSEDQPSVDPSHVIEETDSASSEHRSEIPSKSHAVPHFSFEDGPTPPPSPATDEWLTNLQEPSEGHKANPLTSVPKTPSLGIPLVVSGHSQRRRLQVAVIGIGLTLLILAVWIMETGLPKGSYTAPITPEPTDTLASKVTEATVPSYTVGPTIPVGRSPGGIAVSPDGKRVLVTNQFSYTLGVIDATATTMTKEIRVGNHPTDVTVTPNGKFAFVANYESASVSVINLELGEVAKSVHVGGIPYNLDITPDGLYVYATNLQDKNIAVISTDTNTVQKTIALDSAPTDVEITPDGRRAYVSSAEDSAIYVVDIGTNTVVASVDDTSNPFDLAITPDGLFLYSVHYDDGTVSVIDISSNALVGAIAVDGGPYEVAFAPDGQRAYIPSIGAGIVYVVEVGTKSVIERISMGGDLGGNVAIAPDGARAYLTKSDDSLGVLLLR